jgi:endogenous inhibitor of DNA gyrase (YacG/DUF329 family)
MGIIDTTKHTVRCPKCGTVEATSVHQKGSAYNPYWQDGLQMQNFDLKWTGGGKEEPKILEAKCRACGADAVTEIS